MVEQSYIDGCIELAKFKTKYNVTIKDTINFFKDIKTSDNSNVLINNCNFFFHSDMKILIA